MNYNLVGYAFFVAIIVFIVVVVGKICYKNGNIFIASLIPDQKERCVQINNLLLLGYYLVNIGYAATTIANWEEILTSSRMVEVVASKISFIIVMLSILHYLNILIITASIQKFIKSL